MSQSLSRDKRRCTPGDAWQNAQARFVDAPAGAVAEVQTLVTDVMRSEGYPVNDLGQNTDDLSVDRSRVVSHYRAALAISEENRKADRVRRTCGRRWTLPRALRGSSRNARSCGGGERSAPTLIARENGWRHTKRRPGSTLDEGVRISDAGSFWRQGALAYLRPRMSEQNAGFSEWITPMAARRTSDRFTDPAWTFQRKIDGIRLIAFKSGTQVSLYSRNQLRQHLPTIADAVARLPVRELILDGQLTWDGILCHVFGTMWFDRRDVMANSSCKASRAAGSASVREAAAARFTAARSSTVGESLRGGLGRCDRQETRRSLRINAIELWLKMKCELEHAFVVGGFTDPLGRSAQARLAELGDLWIDLLRNPQPLPSSFMLRDLG